MSKGNAIETSLLALIFNGTTIANVADNAAGSPISSLWVSLHIADPGEAGDQTTSEMTWTGYARVTTSRSTSAWNVSGATASNTGAISFSECTNLSGVATYFAVGTSYSGAGRLLYSGSLTSALTISAGITPYFASGALTVTED